MGGRTTLQRGLVRLIEDACGSARGLGLRTAVGVLPGASLPEQMTAARAADVIAVSPLWRAHGQAVSPYVYEACVAAVAACRESGQEAMAWLQAFSIPSGQEHEITEAAEAMAAAGIANVSTWCYRAGEQMTAIRSERAQVAWEAVVAAYRHLKSASVSG